MSEGTDVMILVDGSSYLFRAYHALPPLMNAEGQATGAIYGVINMLKKLQQDYPNAPLVVVFDSKEPTHRHRLYPEYKAHRPEMPDELASQIQPLHRLIEAMGFPLIIRPGIEADDIIGTLAQQAVQQNKHVIISTGDKDFAQLVNEHIELINTMTQTRLDREGVIQKFGVAPEQIIDYLSLIGDKSDNIPGIPSVGPKTAAQWLNQWGSIENLITHAAELKGKVGEQFRAHQSVCAIAQSLVKIDCDIPLNINIEDLIPTPPNFPALREWFQKLGFQSWLKSLEDTPSETQAPPRTLHAEIINETSTLHALNLRLSQAPSVVLCADTSDERTLLGLMLTLDGEECFYIPIRSSSVCPNVPWTPDVLCSEIRTWIERSELKKIGHPLKRIHRLLLKEGLSLAGHDSDPTIVSYLLDNHQSSELLEELSQKHLKHPITSDVAWCIPLLQCFELHHHFLNTLNTIPRLRELSHQMEHPLIPVLARMEHRGVLLDVEKLAQQSTQLGQQLAALEQRIYAQAGRTFNINSPKQLQEILYQELNLPILEKTATGQPSTAEPVLQELSEQFELPALILDYRGDAKLKSTYTDALPKLIDPHTQRIHTSYHQAITSTGRLSSTDPNLQNIPIRSPQGRAIRQAFIAPPGYVLLSADYSQIELRLMAHFSQDERLCQAFADGVDIHTATAADIFNKPIADVSDEERRRVKAINFGLIYGMSAFGLSKQLHCERSVAAEYIVTYFKRYPGVKTYMEHTRKQAFDQGYVETLWGRRVHLPGIRSKNMAVRTGAERAAINAPLQGTCADLMKKAMIDIDRLLQTHYPDAYLIMQVHDELVFEIPESQLEVLQPQIVTFMCDAITLSVPLQVDVEVGTCWA